MTADEAGEDERVIAGGEEGGVFGEQVGVGAVFVDGVVEDDGLDGEGEGVIEFVFELAHGVAEVDLGFGFAPGVEHEAHAAAAHAAQHPEAPEIRSEGLGGAVDEFLGEEVGGPGDDGLNGVAEVAGGGLADGADIAAGQGGEDFVQDSEHGAAGVPFRGGAE